VIVSVVSFTSTPRRPDAVSAPYTLIAAQSNAVYAAPGYLLFAQEGTLMAQRFDARALTLSGDPVPVAANIGHTTPSSVAMFSASADGRVLSYQPRQKILKNAVLTTEPSHGGYSTLRDKAGLIRRRSCSSTTVWLTGDSAGAGH